GSRFLQRGFADADEPFQFVGRQDGQVGPLVLEDLQQRVHPRLRIEELIDDDHIFAGHEAITRLEIAFFVPHLYVQRLEDVFQPGQAVLRISDHRLTFNVLPGGFATGLATGSIAAMKLRNSLICLFRALPILAFAAVTGPLRAQEFSMTAVAGFNACQIDGDDLAGFDKIGLTAGLRARWETPSIIDYNIEFLYSQRGSPPDVFNPEYDPDINVNLQYAEIPVYVTLSDWWQEEGQYHKVAAHAGFSYGRLINARTEDYFNSGDANLDALVPYFSEND